MTTPAAVIVDAAVCVKAVEDAVKVSAAYYAGGISVLDDDTCDRLVRGIAEWEVNHPDHAVPAPMLGQQRQSHWRGHRTVRAQQRVDELEQFVPARGQAVEWGVPEVSRLGERSSGSV